MKITKKKTITYIEDDSLSESSSEEAKAGSRTAGTRTVRARSDSTGPKSQKPKPTGDSGTSGDEHPKQTATKETKENKVKKEMEGTNPGFIRVDRVFNQDEYRFVLQQSSKRSEVDAFRRYALIVRRVFNYDNEHEETRLDIVSKPLKDSLERVMGEVQSVSLRGDTPSIDPDTAFLFLDDLRVEFKRLKKQSQSKKARQKAQQSAREAKHLKVLVRYLATEYDETMKTLYPLLESRKITFDLLWALFKSNEIICAPTYGVKEELRMFKLEQAHKDISLETRAEYYTVEGRYLEYDGTRLGMSKVTFTIKTFKGLRKISSLACFPFEYHPESANLKQASIQRGKKFVALIGQQHRWLSGRAFQKTKQQVKKYNIDGRVIIDPATFRRFNPDYDVSALYSETNKNTSDSEGSISAGSESSSSEDSEYETKDKGRISRKGALQDDIEELSGEDIGERELTDEQYLIASPVVLGFSLSEKIWVEIAVSGIHDIKWDADSFASLVIPNDKKDRLKALVESHSRKSGQKFDDIIRGKGRGLIILQYGPPGTGKTLAAESVSELLEKPIYNVTTGELGGKQGDVEKNLRVILDLADTWNAVLVIDEAEVFLQQRQPGETASNLLVSIFLRKLEYFNGILILTTNYASSFDVAALSRINIGLKFENLNIKARKNVWRLFVGKAKALPNAQIADLTEEDYATLSMDELNGREIRNIVHTAWAVAQQDNQALSMKYLLQALASAREFAEDVKGPGYQEARKMFL